MLLGCWDGDASAFHSGWRGLGRAGLTSPPVHRYVRTLRESHRCHGVRYGIWRHLCGVDIRNSYRLDSRWTVLHCWKWREQKGRSINLGLGTPVRGREWPKGVILHQISYGRTRRSASEACIITPATGILTTSNHRLRSHHWQLQGMER